MVLVDVNVLPDILTRDGTWFQKVQWPVGVEFRMAVLVFMRNDESPAASAGSPEQRHAIGRELRVARDDRESFHLRLDDD